MSISPISSTCTSPAAQAQPAAKHAAPAQPPQDTVQLSQAALNKLKGVDKDGDGDGK